jgi:uncharacterized membrane protein (UPF0127 family)
VSTPHRSLVLAFVVVLVAGCSTTRTSPADEGPVTPPGQNGVAKPGDPSPHDPPSDRRGVVKLAGAKGEVAVKVEVVATEPLIRRGLMYRQHMPLDAGMLFLMGEEDDHYFYMRNTLIALDIIFISKDMKVVGILHDMKPLDEESKGCGEKSVYVLEVNSGWAKQNGVDTGASVVFEQVHI